jgi:hypothetical protein
MEGMSLSLDLRLAMEKGLSMDPRRAGRRTPNAAVEAGAVSHMEGEPSSSTVRCSCCSMSSLSAVEELTRLERLDPGVKIKARPTRSSQLRTLQRVQGSPVRVDASMHSAVRIGTCGGPHGTFGGCRAAQPPLAGRGLG